MPSGMRTSNLLSFRVQIECEIILGNVGGYMRVGRKVGMGDGRIGGNEEWKDVEDELGGYI